MRKPILVFILLLASLPSTALANPPLKGKWTLTLDENFNNYNQKLWSKGLETNKLHVRRSKCFYRDDNVSVANGFLLITSKKEKLKLIDKDGNKKTMKFSSGFVHSFRKFKQKYGYFEIRMKLPQARGLWPAFWLMPDRSKKIQDPQISEMRSTGIEKDRKDIISGKGMEIDIMEHLTEWDANKFHYAAHWDGYKTNLKSFRGSQLVGTNPDKDGFRKFGLYWGENILIWFVDDIEIARWQNNRISDVPMYIIINTNMGGWATDHIEKKKLPDQTIIDYVRVWQGKAKL